MPSTLTSQNGSAWDCPCGYSNLAVCCTKCGRPAPPPPTIPGQENIAMPAMNASLHGRRRHRDELAQMVAEVGASLCCYAPGAGNPEAWPTSRCDCKYGGSGQGEQTGCAEARTIHRMLTNPDVTVPWWSPR